MVYEVLLVVYATAGGICQIYSPAFVWDDITTIVYIYIYIYIYYASNTVPFMWGSLQLNYN